jgi:uncharacterized membrane protein
MAKMVFGIFTDRKNAETAINELESEGFNPKDISIVMQNKEDADIIRNNTGANVAESTASGAATGAAIGGLAGLLIGIGAIAIPGIGALLIGGPIAAALGLTGAAATTVSGAATGALAGGLIGALVGIGVPEEDARIYEERVKSGAILVAVPAFSSEHREASAILRENGAEQIKSIDMADRSTHSEMQTGANM